MEVEASGDAATITPDGEPAAACAAVEAAVGSSSSSAPAAASSVSSTAVSGKPTAALSYKGVVYNEMKGVYSNPDSLHAMECENSLFTGGASESGSGASANYKKHPYANSSGGDPLAIPSLSYQQFKSFHETHYHPSNSKLWFFGDDSEADRLSIIADHLKGFQARPEAPAASIIPLHPQAHKPITVSVPYPVGGNDGEGAEVPPANIAVHSTDASASASSAADTTRTANGGSSGGSDLNDVNTLPGAPDSHYVTVNWLLHPSSASAAGHQHATLQHQQGQSHGHAEDVDRLGLAVLNHLLMGTQAATLRKALTDSGLGSSVTGGGLEDGLVQPTFSAGLKGVKAADVHKIEHLVTHALTMAAGTGFDKDHVQASLNTIEFAMREFATGGSPRGLALFLGVVQGWIYGRDPFSELRYEAALSGLKQKVAESPEYFQNLIRELLIFNPHKSIVHSFPDPQWSARREEVERKRLDGIASKLSEAELQKVHETAADLLQRQATPDSAEALATVPSLKVEDVPKENSKVERDVRALDIKGSAPSTSSAGAAPAAQVAVAGEAFVFSTPSPAAASPSMSSSRPTPVLLAHEHPTSGIGYGKLLVDLSHLPQRLVPLLPLFSWCLTSTGTKTKDEVALSRAMGIHTGGISSSISAAEVPGHPELAIPLLSISGKALGHSVDKMGELIAEVLTTARMDRKDRIAHYLRERIAGHESGLVSAGHRYAGSILGSQLTKAAWLSEVWGGVTNLSIARMLLPLASPQPSSSASTAGMTSGSADALIADLEEIRSYILSAPQHGSVLVAATGDANTLPKLTSALAAAVQSMDVGSHSASAADSTASAGEAGKHRFASGWTWPGHAGSNSIADPSVVTAGVALPLTPLAALGQSASSTAGAGSDEGSSAIGIGIVVPTQVNYVVKAGATAHRAPAAAPSTPGAIWHAGTPGSFSISSSSSAPSFAATAAMVSVPSTRFASTGGAEVVANQLRTGYLWERVRVQGGAYGGFCSLSSSSGVLSFTSYRDPNLAQTLANFDGTASHLRELASPSSAAHTSAVSEDIRKAIISTIGGIDAPMSPGERGAVSMSRYVTGVTEAMLQQRREEVLSASSKDMAVFAEVAENVSKIGRIAVVGSEQAFAQAADKHKFTLFRPLLK